jgi:hypothetical protein
LFAPLRRRDCQTIVRFAAHKATRGRPELRLNCVMAVPIRFRDLGAGGCKAAASRLVQTLGTQLNATFTSVSNAL